MFQNCLVSVGLDVDIMPYIVYCEASLVSIVSDKKILKYKNDEIPIIELLKNVLVMDMPIVVLILFST